MMSQNETSCTDAFDGSIDVSDILEDGEALNEDITLAERCDQSSIGLNTLSDQCTLSRSICLSSFSDLASTKHTTGSDVPESLAPLLSGGEASWSSSFATPTTAETTNTFIVPENTENSFIDCSENNEECMIFPSMKISDVLNEESENVTSAQNTTCKDFIELEISLHQSINDEKKAADETLRSCDENIHATNVNTDELVNNSENLLSVSSICGDENVMDKFEKKLGELCVQNISDNVEIEHSSRKCGFNDSVPVLPSSKVSKETCKVSNLYSTPELFQDISFSVLDKLCRESEFLTADTTPKTRIKNLKNSSKSPFCDIASPGSSNSVPYFIRTSTPFSNVKRRMTRNKNNISNNLAKQCKSEIELFSCLIDQPNLKNSKCLSQSESNLENDKIICNMFEESNECEVLKFQIPTLSAIKSAKENQNKLSLFFYRSLQINSVKHSNKNIICLDDLTKSALVLELAENMRQKNMCSYNDQKEILKFLSAFNDDSITVSELQAVMNLQKNKVKVKLLSDYDDKDLKKHSDTNFVPSIKDNKNLTNSEVRSYLHDESTIVLNADSDCCSDKYSCKQSTVWTLDCETDARRDIDSTSDNEDIIQYSLSPVLNSVGSLKTDTVDLCCNNNIHEHVKISNVSVNNVNGVNDKSDIPNSAKRSVATDSKSEIEGFDIKTKPSDNVSETQLIYALDAAEKMYELMQCDEQFSEWPIKINSHDSSRRCVIPNDQEDVYLGSTKLKNSEESVTPERRKEKKCERLQRSSSDDSFSSVDMFDMVAKTSHIEEQIFNSKQHNLTDVSENNLQNISIPVCKNKRDTKFIRQSENFESKSEECTGFLNNYESANENIDEGTYTGVEYQLKHTSNADKYTSFLSLKKVNLSNVESSSKMKLQKFISSLSNNKNEKISHVSDSVDHSASHLYSKNQPYVTDFLQKAKKVKIFHTSSNVNSLVNNVHSESHSLNTSTSNSSPKAPEIYSAVNFNNPLNVRKSNRKNLGCDQITPQKDEYPISSTNKTPEKKEIKSITPKFQAFSTASGKKVNISKKSLSKVKQMFQDVDMIFVDADDKVANSVEPSIEATVPKDKTENTTPKFQGFTTASGKKVDVSEKSLSKVKQMFFVDGIISVENVDKGDASKSISATEPKKTTPKIDLKSKFQGFITTSGKKVHDDISPVLRTRKKYFDSPILRTQNEPLLTEFCVESPVLVTQRQNIVHVESPVSGTRVEKTLSPESRCDSPCLGTPRVHLREDNICNEKFFLEKTDRVNEVVNENLLTTNTNVSVSNLNLQSQQGLSDSIGTKNLSGIMRVKKCLFGSSKSEKTLKQIMNESNSNVNFASLSCDELDRTTNVIMNFSDEVLESIAMFLEDEQSDNPSWAATYITSPNMLADRCMSPLVNFSPTDNLAAQNPIFGLNDRFETDDEKCLHHSETTNKIPVTRDSKGRPCEKSMSLQKTISNPTTNIRKRIRVDFTSPLAKRLHVSTFNNERDHVVIAEARRKAAEDQEAKICELKKSTVKTYKGSLYHKKMRKNRLLWREVADGQLPACYTATELCSVGVESSVIGVTAANAIDYRFCVKHFYSPDICEKNVSGIHVGDGALLILDEAGFAGVNEFSRAFLCSPGVDPSLVPSVSWITNHFRWIVWKLACIERSFPKQFEKCLTPNNVMLQLKYRYDCEIELSQSPAIRKILERDDTSVKRLVLCVADIRKADTSSSSSNGDSRNKPLNQSAYELELTDGWYSVWSTVDCEMTKFIESNLVTVGTKLITCGAELLNCDQGCSPLEVNKNVRLKLHTNSTRRARWYTKLGYQDNSGAFPVSLSTVLPAGGLVSYVSVVIVRVYPVVYLEKLANRKTVMRGPRAEEREVTCFERKRQEKAEKILSQLRAEITETVPNKRRTAGKLYSADKIRKITSGEELYQLLSESSDPTYFQNIISDEQKVELTEYQQQYQEDLNRQLEARLAEQLNDVTRKVASVFKVRCLDVNNMNSDKCSAVLSVWRATEDVMGLFKEGLSMRLYKVTPTGHRCKGSELQLSANRSTRYKPLKTVDYPSRMVTCLQQVTMKDFCPLFNEMDVVGVVIYTRVTSTHSETVYVADASGAILGICFWGSIKDFGFDDILTPEKFIAASNLQWKTRGHSHIPCAYATEQSLFSLNHVQQHLKEALSQLKLKVGHDVKSFVESCKKNMERTQKATQCVVPNRKHITHV